MLVLDRYTRDFNCIVYFCLTFYCFLSYLIRLDSWLRFYFYRTSPRLLKQVSVSSPVQNLCLKKLSRRSWVYWQQNSPKRCLPWRFCTTLDHRSSRSSLRSSLRFHHMFLCEVLLKRLLRAGERRFKLTAFISLCCSQCECTLTARLSRCSLFVILFLLKGILRKNLVEELFPFEFERQCLFSLLAVIIALLLLAYKS